MKKLIDPFEIISRCLNSVVDEVNGNYTYFLKYMSCLNRVFLSTNDRFKQINSSLQNCLLAPTFSPMSESVKKLSETATDNFFCSLYDLFEADFQLSQKIYNDEIDKCRPLILSNLQKLNETMKRHFKELKKMREKKDDVDAFQIQLLLCSQVFNKSVKKIQPMIDSFITISHNQIENIHQNVIQMTGSLMNKLNIELSDLKSNAELNSILKLTKYTETFLDFNYFYRNYLQKVDYFELDSHSVKGITVSLKEPINITDESGNNLSLSVGEVGIAEIVGYSKHWKVSIKNTTCYIPSNFLSISQ